MRHMIFQVIRVDQNVIEVRHTEYVYESSKSIIYITLESSGGIGETHWHDQPFVKAIAGSHCCFILLSFCHADAVIPITNIKASIIFSFAELVKGFVDTR